MDLFSLLSEWIILSSDSFVQINGDLHMGPHNPPRASSSLCHCHGDSSEWSRYMAGLVRDTQRFLVVPQSHMDTVAASSAIKDIKEIDFSFPWISSSMQPLLSASALSTSLQFNLYFLVFLSDPMLQTALFPQCLVSNRLQTSPHSDSEVQREIEDQGGCTHS